MYVSLKSRQSHAEKCTERACVSACGFRRFEAWLAEPVTTWDVRADERIEERRKALMRGEIPA